MRPILLFKLSGLSILLFFCVSSHCQVPVIQWQKCFGGTDDEKAYEVISTESGGYLLAGASRSTNGTFITNYGLYDAYLINTDSIGNVIWQKNYGGSGSEYFYDVIQTFNGGFLAIGNTFSNNVDVIGQHGQDDAWVVKISPLGVIEWQRALGGSRSDEATSLLQTPEGNYLIGGTTASTDGDLAGIGTRNNEDFWVVCINGSGTILWQKTYGGSRSDILNSIIKSGDGNFILAGKSQSFDGDVTNGVPSTFPDFVTQGWVLKINAIGNIVWEKSYGSRVSTLLGENFTDVKQTTDSGYIFSGICSANGSIVLGHHSPQGNPDYWILKLDALGDFQWQKVYGGSFDEYAQSIRSTLDGGWILTGHSNSSDFDVTNTNNTNASYDMWVVKISAIGALEWQKCFGGNSSDNGSIIYQTANLGFITVGTTLSSNSGDVTTSNGSGDMWFVKFSPATTVPIKLTNYEAVWQGNVVINSWQTQQEVNSSQFEIERSTDAIHFIKAGSQPAAGNSATVRNYTFIDRLQQSLTEERFYYRLKMVDIDGSYSYSRIVELNKGNSQQLLIIPNPVQQTMNVHLFAKRAAPITLLLYDMAGKKISSKKLNTVRGNIFFQIDVSRLAKGSYLLVAEGEQTLRQQILKL